MTTLIYSFVLGADPPYYKQCYTTNINYEQVCINMEILRSAQNDENRHSELDSESIKTDLNPSPCPAWLFAFNGSAQACTSASLFALSSQSASHKGRGKLSDKVFSRFTSLFSLNLYVLMPYCPS